MVVKWGSGVSVGKLGSVNKNITLRSINAAEALTTLPTLPPYPLYHPTISPLCASDFPQLPPILHSKRLEAGAYGNFCTPTSSTSLLSNQWMFSKGSLSSPRAISSGV